MWQKKKVQVWASEVQRWPGVACLWQMLTEHATPGATHKPKANVTMGHSSYDTNHNGYGYNSSSSNCGSNSSSNHHHHHSSNWPPCSSASGQHPCSMTWTDNEWWQVGMVGCNSGWCEHWLWGGRGGGGAGQSALPSIYLGEWAIASMAGMSSSTNIQSTFS